MEKEIIEILVDGAKASPGPTTAPKLALLKLNVGEVFKKINEATKDYGGLKVPVKIIVDKLTGKYELKIGIPPVSSLIKKELGIEKAKFETEVKSAEGETKAEAKGKTTGNLSMEEVVKIAKIKKEDLLARDLRAAVKQVVGTCVSMMGITIENKKPKEILKEIEEGKWDHLLKS